MNNNKKTIIGVSIGIVVIGLFLLIMFLNKPVYEVSFVSNNEVIETIKVEKNQFVSKPIDLVRDGYTFDGWYFENEPFDFGTRIRKDIILTARWTVTVDNTNERNVTVNFDSVGGTDVAAQIVEINSRVKMPVPPERDGYKFVEWQLNSAAFDFDTVITESITLTAKWEKVDNQQDTGTTDSETQVKYTVVFNSGEGSAVKTQIVESGKTAVKPENPTRSGYTFKGWYYDNSEFNFNIKITKNIVLTAKWEKNTQEVVKYTVKFNSNDGSSVSSQTVVSGQKATKPEDPTRSGYTFKGWYYNNSEYDFNTKVTSNIVLTAIWEKNGSNEEIVKYTVTFNTGEGSKVNSQTIESGNKATKPENPTRSGYTFKGWYYNNSEYDFNTQVTKNIELVALWEEEAVITYDIRETASTVGQVKIFVLKNDQEVAGIIRLTTKKGNVVENLEIPKTGYVINIGSIEKIDNVRVK